MADKIFVYKYVPEYVPQGLKWYERNGLMVYIDQLNCQRFSEDPDGYLKKSDVVNFDIINSQIRGTARQNYDKHYDKHCPTSDVRRKMP